MQSAVGKKRIARGRRCCKVMADGRGAGSGPFGRTDIRQPRAMALRASSKSATRLCRLAGSERAPADAADRRRSMLGHGGNSRADRIDHVLVRGTGMEGYGSRFSGQRLCAVRFCPREAAPRVHSPSTWLADRQVSVHPTLRPCSFSIESSPRSLLGWAAGLVRMGFAGISDPSGLSAACCLPAVHSEAHDSCIEHPAALCVRVGCYRSLRAELPAHSKKTAVRDRPQTAAASFV